MIWPCTYLKVTHTVAWQAVCTKTSQVEQEAVGVIILLKRKLKEHDRGCTQKI